VHPLILESLAEQRIDDLRASRSDRRGGRGRRPAKRSSGSGSNPMGRAQAKVGLWMVDTGTRLVKHGDGARVTASLTRRTALASQ
jgi:hypothetical protein